MVDTRAADPQREDNLNQIERQRDFEVTVLQDAADYRAGRIKAYTLDELDIILNLNGSICVSGD